MHSGRMTFTRLLIFAVVTLGLTVASAAADPFALHDGDRVVVYGDSITAQNRYSMMAEMFTLTRFPKLAVDWWNAGIPSDTVTGGWAGAIDLRLNRDVFAYKPTRVTIMLGMNDGGVQPFNAASFDAFQKGYTHILDAIKSADPATKVTIIQPSPYDDVTHPPKFEGGYNAVLVKFGEYLKGLAQSRGLETVDFNTPVVAMLHKAGSIDPELAKTLMPDRVHPSPGGHLIMTEALLRSWNFPRVISAISIDAGAGKVVQADGAVVTNLGATGPTIKWESLESALPLPIDFSDPTIALAIKSSDVIDAIDQETLKITGLSAPKYELRIDYSLVGAFTNDQLAAGVNLATLRTPMLGQALGVAAIVNWHLAVGGRYRTMMAPLQTDPDPGVKQALAAMAGQLSALDAALAAEEHGIVMKQRAAAQPITRHFVLTPAP